MSEYTFDIFWLDGQRKWCAEISECHTGRIVHTTRPVANKETAERHACKWIKNKSKGNGR